MHMENNIEDILKELRMDDINENTGHAVLKEKTTTEGLKK